MEQAAGTDDELDALLANADTNIEPQPRKANPVNTPQREDVDMDAVTRQKRAGEDAIGDQPTNVDAAIKKLNLCGENKVAGAASSSAKA